jgi:hypothetical protein
MGHSPAPAISVILRIFNRASFLRQAFDSIRSESYTDWELVVIDDGSTDDTRKTVERVRTDIAQPVRYVHQITDVGATTERWQIARDVESAEIELLNRALVPRLLPADLRRKDAANFQPDRARRDCSKP